MILIKTEEAFDDLMICGHGEVTILMLAFDPSQTAQAVPNNPYLGATKPLAQAAYQDQMAVESFEHQGWRYHLLQVSNAVWTWTDGDARFFYTLLGHLGF